MYEEELFAPLDRSLNTDYFKTAEKPSARGIKPVETTTAKPKTKKSTDWSSIAGMAGSGLSAYNAGKDDYDFKTRNANIGMSPEAQKRAQENAKVDQIGKGVASAAGPWYGMLADAGLSVSEDLRGDGMNYDKNVQANFTDPFNQFKNNEDADDWVGSFLAPTASAHIKAERQTEEAEKEYRRGKDKQRVQNQSTGTKFQNSLDRYSAPGYGRKGMKIKNKLTYGSKAY